MSVVSYKCPNCDGELVFKPEIQKFGCDYCLSTFTEEELIAADKNHTIPDLEQPQSEPKDTDNDDSVHMVEYHCPSCGAEIVTDDTTAATFCYYCHNPVLIANRLSGAFKPDKIVPFALEREQAKELFLNWCKKKWFIDKRFFHQSQLEKMTGIYFPFWLVDTEVSAHMSAKARNVRVWRTGDIEYTETNVYQLEKDADIFLRDIPLEALQKDYLELIKGVYPYQTEKMIAFSLPYLSGFQAEKRAIEQEESAPKAKEMIRNYTETLLRGSVSQYGSVSVEDLSIHSKKEDWEYALLPIWLLTYKYKDKNYYYAMNGQTGKIFGLVPVSVSKLWALFASVSGILFLILLIGGMLL